MNTLLPPSVSIENEKQVSIDDVLAEADTMWRKLRKAGISEESMEAVRKEHRDFSSGYPIVLRYMGQNEYRTSTFRKFLQWVQRNPWKTPDEFLDAQTKYVVMLYKDTHPRYQAKDVHTLKTNIRKILQDEHDEITAMVKKVQKEVEAEEARLHRETRETLRGHYRTYGEEAIDIPLRIGLDGEPIPVAKKIEVSPDYSAVPAMADDLLG